MITWTTLVIKLGERSYHIVNKPFHTTTWLFKSSWIILLNSEHSWINLLRQS